MTIVYPEANIKITIEAKYAKEIDAMSYNTYQWAEDGDRYTEALFMTNSSFYVKKVDVDIKKIGDKTIEDYYIILEEID